jgi:S-adenosylmethionine-dependent methyltransferase
MIVCEPVPSSCSGFGNLRAVPVPQDGVFATAVPRWLAGLGTMHDVVRQELVTRQLRYHLPPREADPPPRVVDVGCGQGTQALRLAAAGYQVTGVDTSAELLKHARRITTTVPEAVRQRLRWERADLFDFAAGHPAQWDVVCCHGVVMYLPSLPAAINAVVTLARPGGLVSVLSHNQAGIAMRAGMARRWHETLAGFDADHYTNRLGVTGVRADRPEAVQAALHIAGADTLAWYGVRLFTDPWATTDESAPDLDTLLAAEEQAGRRDPYRRLAALTHTLAKRRNSQPDS